MIDGVPVTTTAYSRTVRLVSTARLRESVLAPLVDDADELAELAEIEGATSSRSIAESTGISGLGAHELVYDVPHAHFINASFAYAKPREPNRFNGENRGAWYAALDVETCLAEITFHMTEFLARTGRFEAVVEYAEMFCSLSGDFLDLRPLPRHPALHRDKEIGYREGNTLAAQARAQGLNGIIYPSVRHPGGTCFAVLRPAAVQSVRQGDVYRLIWAGDPSPAVEGPIGA
ncbi:RES domain-containing protein [Pseudorhizobium endolithicum]|uniref:RES domain-containing protein n=1 Tax=Pseudorhizobium endolithicum TaxID=1191678 RepID=A0ABM8PWT8_9HYPH|nr:RES family NAD+ phosphorylase [Pseudorhizobium endolithicum]CAD7052802.1 RES domain-containing protein [Pseudorhizobium endolithicum]